jgi:hypothetical protein
MADIARRKRKSGICRGGVPGKIYRSLQKREGRIYRQILYWVAFPGIGSKDDITIYQKALAQGDLHLRIIMMIHAEFLMKEAGGFLTGFGNERLKIGPAKIIGDGSIQAYTAWLSQPYFVPFKGDQSYRGYPVTPPEKLNQLVMEAHRAGKVSGLHRIG